MKENQSKIRKNPKRQELDKKDCWRLEDLYATDLAWEQDALKVKEQLDGFSAYQGTLGVSAENLLAVLRAQDALMLRMERLYVYASQKWHQDMGNANYQNMSDRAQALMTQVEDSASYVEPELLEIPGEKMEQFLREEPELAVYKRFIEEKIRKKDHILTKELEGVLAKAGELGQSPQTIFSMFNNADLKFGTIRDENGTEQELTHGRYVQFLESRDRQVRQEAFFTLYKAYDAFRNTLAATFLASVKKSCSSHGCAITVLPGRRRWTGPISLYPYMTSSSTRYTAICPLCTVTYSFAGERWEFRSFICMTYMCPWPKVPGAPIPLTRQKSW